MKLFYHAIFFFCCSLYGPIASSDPHQSSGRQSQALSHEQELTCHQALQKEMCSNGLAQAEFDLAFKQGAVPSATALLKACRRNSKGKYCTLSHRHVSDISAIMSACQPALAGDCPSKCKDRLVRIGGDLGCCLNVLCNGTYSWFVQMPDASFAFRHKLWTKCGVEPITEECTPSSITVNKSDSPGFHMPPSFHLGELFELTCTGKYMNSIRNALRKAGNCEHYIQLISKRCAVSETGEMCGTLYDSYLEEQLDQAHKLCDMGQTCSEECAQALKKLVDVGGCCVGTLFNVTLTELSLIVLDAASASLGYSDVPLYDFMDFAFWSSCGMEPLQACKVKMNE